MSGKPVESHPQDFGACLRNKKVDTSGWTLHRITQKCVLSCSLIVAGCHNVVGVKKSLCTIFLGHPVSVENGKIPTKKVKVNQWTDKEGGGKQGQCPCGIPLCQLIWPFLFLSICPGHICNMLCDSNEDTLQDYFSTFFQCSYEWIAISEHASHFHCCSTGYQHLSAFQR